MMIITVVCTVIFAAVATVLVQTRGWSWVTIASVLMVIVGVAGIIERFVVRIQLTDDALIATDLRGTRRYEKAAIERIEEAKGGPPAIRLKDGKWAELPSVESSLGNSVRAWLKG